MSLKKVKRNKENEEANKLKLKKKKRKLKLQDKYNMSIRTVNLIQL